MLKFDRSTPDWTPLVPGELGKLHLSGSQGDLDIFSVYMPTGSQASEGNDLPSMRGRIRSILARFFSSSSVLSLVGGDFNFVACDEDRYTKTSMTWSGRRDAAEQKDWEDQVELPHSLHELHQPMATHNSGIAWSRLDTGYSNHHVVEQMDARFGCSCLDWCPQLSHHRPVFFSKPGPLLAKRK